MNNHKLRAVPVDEREPTKGEIFTAKIEQRNRELIAKGFKAYAYQHPEKQAAKWDQNESSRKGTKYVVIDRPIPLFRRIWRKMKGVR